jgi:hypothetical protein
LAVPLPTLTCNDVIDIGDFALSRVQFADLSSMPRGRPRTGDDGTRCDIRPSSEQAAYLDDLVRVGLYGKTRTEVARYLVVRGLERLVEAGVLALRRDR